MSVYIENSVSDWYQFVENLSIQDIENWTICNAIATNNLEDVVFTEKTLRELSDWDEKTRNFVFKRFTEISDMMDDERPDSWYKLVLIDLFTKINFMSNLSKPMPCFDVVPKLTNITNIVQRIIKSVYSGGRGAFIEYIKSESASSSKYRYSYEVNTIHGNYRLITLHAQRVIDYLVDQCGMCREDLKIDVMDYNECFINTVTKQPLSLTEKMIRIIHSDGNTNHTIVKYTMCKDLETLRPLGILMKAYELSDF